MKKEENLQENLQKDLQSTPKRGRKKMEKMEVSNEPITISVDKNGTISASHSQEFESSSVTYASTQPVESEIFVTGLSAGENVTKWIINNNFTKTCEACGAVMMGWAYREKFAYCPKCGAKAEKAQ